MPQYLLCPHVYLFVRIIFDGRLLIRIYADRTSYLSNHKSQINCIGIIFKFILIIQEVSKNKK